MHVALRVAGALAVRLEHADGREDLELADGGDVVPLLLGRHAGDVAAVRREPVLAGDDRERLNDEAEEAGHGDAAVLDLGVAEVADRGLVAEAPTAAAARRAGARRSRGVCAELRAAGRPRSVGAESGPPTAAGRRSVVASSEAVAAGELESLLGQRAL